MAEADESDATADVLRANQRFYDAHEQRDMAAMQDIWSTEDDIVCVHPGWQILRGHDAVLDSWRRILNGPGRNQFILTNVAVTVDGALGWVTLDENLVDGAATGTIAATNLFRRTPDGWRMVLHHGSPVMA